MTQKTLSWELFKHKNKTSHHISTPSYHQMGRFNDFEIQYSCNVLMILLWLIILVSWVVKKR